MTISAVAGIEPWLVAAVERLAAGEALSLDGLLVAVGEPRVLDGTRTQCRCHFIVRDGNGRPRVTELAERLADEVIDYCIPRARIADARRHLERTGRPTRYAQLAREARELFTTLEKTGEGGELLLYVLLESVVRAPQLLCKMSLKTNSQMHVHGADGVHARMLANGNLALYWGESKLHGSASKAVDECFASVAPYLTGAAQGKAARRDLLLVRDNLDAGEAALTAALIDYFDRDNPKSAKVEVRAACLVGFSMTGYPGPFDPDGVSIHKEVERAMRRWHDRITARVGDHKLAAFEIEVFCVPIPSVSAFRSAIRDRLGLG